MRFIISLFLCSWLNSNSKKKIQALAIFVNIWTISLYPYLVTWQMNRSIFTFIWSIGIEEAKNLTTFVYRILAAAWIAVSSYSSGALRLSIKGVNILTISISKSVNSSAFSNYFLTKVIFFDKRTEIVCNITQGIFREWFRFALKTR